MAFVNFKKGTLTGLKNAQIAEGTFYVTTDEHAIYLDISGEERIRLGDFQEFATLEALKANTNPSTTALYYVKDINCLAKYTDSGYIQINPDTGATKVAKSGEGNAVADIGYDESTRTLTLTMTTLPTTTEVNNAIDTKVGNIGEYDTVAEYVDAKTEGIASDEALNELNGRVQTAEGDIEDLQKLVGEDSVATQIGDAIAGLGDTYETKDDAASKKAELEAAIDEKQDALEFETEYNAETNKAATMADVTAAVAGLSGAMHFKGTVDTNPAEMQSFDGYAEGDVVVYQQKEFVFNGTQFIELGDVTAEAQRISTIENQMTNAEGDIRDLENKLEGIGETVTGYVGDQIDAAKTSLVGDVGGVSANTIQGAVAEANAYTDDAITDVEATIGEIQDELGGLGDKYDAKGTAATAVEAIQNGESISDFGGVETALGALDEKYDTIGTALTWGSF